MGNAIKRSTFSALALAVKAAAGLSILTINAYGQPALTPAKINDQQKSNQSYQECVGLATRAVKSGKLQTQDLAVAVSRCGEKFPSIALFNSCKKSVLKNAKGKDLSALDFSQCKKIQSAVDFNPAVATPLYVGEGMAFFAGVGLNHELSVNDMQAPNFTCERFSEAVKDIPNKAHHILFGNNARMFLTGPEQAKYLQALKVRASKIQKGKKYNDIIGLGRVFGEPLTEQSMIYFPSASCDFKGVSGQTLSGLSIYYLPDNEAKMATPYFGIAYYKANQKTITTPELVADLLSKLGSDFMAYSKDASTVFISARPFQEVDRERDPRNICKLPRQHQFVAVVRTMATNSNTPEYLLLANVRNLCDYGDRLARKMAQQ